MQLQIEAQEGMIDKTIQLGGGMIMTPPINEGYWLFRVPVSDKQAVVAFPKFGTIGIGFQHEEDWNCNLPYSCGTDEIFNHIADNKGDESIPDERCKDAIRLLQEAATNYKKSSAQ